MSRCRSNSVSDASSAALKPGLDLPLRFSPRNVSPAQSRSGSPSPLITTPTDSMSPNLSSVSHISESDLDVSGISGQNQVTGKRKQIKLKSCPSGNSSEGRDWTMVCTDCKQWWHGSCANVKGASKLKKPDIDSISKTWLCHWCYVCPYQRPENRPSALKQQSH